MTPATIQPLNPTTNELTKALEKFRQEQKVSLTEADSPHILIVGPSGSGKSRSLINLPPEHTWIFNPESKALPFESAAKFKDKKLSGFTNITQMEKLFKAVTDDIESKYIVFDSFTEYLELLMKEARAINKGYEIFNYYNTCVSSFLFNLRKIKNKIVILTGIDEMVKVEEPTGAITTKRHMSIEGKVWLTKVESKFTIVLFTDVKKEVGSNPPKMTYQFATNTDGVTSAKSPEGMFPFYIPNDLQAVVQKVEKYFGINQP